MQQAIGTSLRRLAPSPRLVHGHHEPRPAVGRTRDRLGNLPLGKVRAGLAPGAGGGIHRPDDPRAARADQKLSSTYRWHPRKREPRRERMGRIRLQGKPQRSSAKPSRNRDRVVCGQFPTSDPHRVRLPDHGIDAKPRHRPEPDRVAGEGIPHPKGKVERIHRHAQGIVGEDRRPGDPDSRLDQAQIDVVEGHAGHTTADDPGLDARDPGGNDKARHHLPPESVRSERSRGKRGPRLDVAGGIPSDHAGGDFAFQAADLGPHAPLPQLTRQDWLAHRRVQGPVLRPLVAHFPAFGPTMAAGLEHRRSGRIRGTRPQGVPAERVGFEPGIGHHI